MKLFHKILENEFDSIDNLSKVCNLRSWNKEDYRKAFFDPNYKFIIAKMNLEIIGFVMFREIFEEIEIINICVNKLHRRKGVAKKLIEQCINDALLKPSTKKIWLEVRESNIGAINLYSTVGFVNCGLRKNYYSNPTENGITMYRSLSN